MRLLAWLLVTGMTCVLVVALIAAGVYVGTHAPELLASLTAPSGLKELTQKLSDYGPLLAVALLGSALSGGRP